MDEDVAVRGRWPWWFWRCGAGVWDKARLRAQENPLDEVHTPAPPPPPKTPEDKKPVIEGADNAAKLATSSRDARIGWT